MVRFGEFDPENATMQKRFVIWLALAMLLLPHAGVHAQGGVKLAFLSVELWSEFDQPSMLVINEFALSPQVPLPVEIKWRYPNEGNLVAVAFESEGLLLNSAFESSAEQGAWQTITLQVDTYNTYHIEYYQPLSRESEKRRFTYKWFGDYSVDDFRLSVSLPADSANVETTPAFNEFEPVPDRNQIIGSDTQEMLRMGHSYQFDLAYDRVSDELTGPGQATQVNPSEPLTPETPGRISVDSLPWIIGGVGIALIGFGLFFYWRSTGAGSASSKRTRKRSQHSSAQKDSAEPLYCHECGTRANPGDRFCRTCGSRLRTE
jgi:hypothetical protein